MSFPKLAFSLSFAGLLAGLGFSLRITPRFTTTASMIVKDDTDTRDLHRKFVEGFRGSVAKIQSGEWLAEWIEISRYNAWQFNLYKEERERMPIEKVAAIVREAIEISFENSGAQSLSILRIKAAYRDRRGAMDLANAVMSYLNQRAILSSAIWR